MKPIKSMADLEAAKARGLSKLVPATTRISVGMGTCGIGNGADLLFAALEKAAAKAAGKNGMAPVLKKVGCFGF